MVKLHSTSCRLQLPHGRCSSHCRYQLGRSVSIWRLNDYTDAAGSRMACVHHCEARIGWVAYLDVACFASDTAISGFLEPHTGGRHCVSNSMLIFQKLLRVGYVALGESGPYIYARPRKRKRDKCDGIGAFGTGADTPPMIGRM